VAAAGAADVHARAVADTIRNRFAGQTVLVVGHSNTIPAIVGALGAPRPPDLCDAQYDQLFVVVISDGGPARLIRSRYGAPSDDSSPACAGMR
jgi:broad specificity phosphatase PhoE